MKTMKNMPFHQFQRYETAKNLVNDMRQGDCKLRILEVGSGIHKNLAWFLPSDDIVFLEKNIPEGYNADGRIVCGDATDLKFDDNSFDIIIALDVYEHIPIEKRDIFLKEISRVARIGIIIAAPFASDLNIKHEKELLEYGKNIFTTIPVWLSEHEELGLPDLDTAISKVNSLDLHVFSFGHGDANLSSLMLKAELLASTSIDGQYYMLQLHDYYNRYVYDNDFADIAVRNFIVGLKEHEDVISKIRKKVTEVEKKRVGQKQIERINCLIRLIEQASADSSKPVGNIKLFLGNNNKFTATDFFMRNVYDGYNRLEFELLDDEEVTTIKLCPLKRQYAIKELSITVERNNGSRERASIIVNNYFYKNNVNIYFNNADADIIFNSIPDIHKVIVEFVVLDETIEENNALDILLVTYNHEKYIRQAIESVLMQNTSFPYKVIVCDDASSDRTMEIISEYVIRYPNMFKILPREANMGITQNYIRGFENCTSNYIAVLEGDDYWIDDNRLEQMVSYLNEDQDCSMCFNKLILFNETTGTYIKHNNSLIGEEYQKLKFDDLAKDNFIGNFSCCLYRRDIIKKIIAGHNGMVAYDWLTNLECAEVGYLGYITKVMSAYRIHDNGVWSGQETKKQNEALIKTIDEYDAFFSYAHHDAFMEHKERVQGAFKAEIPEVPEEKPIHIKILRKLMPRNIYVKARAIYHIIKGS